MIAEVNSGEGAGGLPTGKWTSGKLKAKCKKALALYRTMAHAAARMDEVFGNQWRTRQRFRVVHAQITRWLSEGRRVVIVVQGVTVDVFALRLPGEPPK